MANRIDCCDLLLLKRHPQGQWATKVNDFFASKQVAKAFAPLIRVEMHPLGITSRDWPLCLLLRSFKQTHAQVQVLLNADELEVLKLCFRGSRFAGRQAWLLR